MESRRVGVPLDDVDLLALQFADHRLDARTPHANAGADGVNARVVGNHGDLGARAGIPGHRLDLDDAVVNFRNLLGKQLGHEVGVAAGQEYLGAAGLFPHVQNESADTVAGGEVFARDAFVAAQEGLRPSQVDDDVAEFYALDQPVDDFAEAILELVVLTLALGFAHFLHDHLLGGLGGDAPKIYRRQRLDQEFADLGVRLALARFLQGDLRNLFLNRLGHLDIAGQIDDAGRAVDGGADVMLVTVFGTPRLLDGLLHGFQHFLALDTLVARHRFRHLQQFGARMHCLSFHFLSALASLRCGEQLVGDHQLGPPDVGERHLDGVALHFDPYGISGNAEEAATEMPALRDGPARLEARLEPGETLEVLEAHQRTIDARRAHFQGVRPFDGVVHFEHGGDGTADIRAIFHAHCPAATGLRHYLYLRCMLARDMHPHEVESHGLDGGGDQPLDTAGQFHCGATCC